MTRLSAPVNVVYVHGFTMHDLNFPVHLVMKEGGLADFAANSPELARYLAYLEKSAKEGSQLSDDIQYFNKPATPEESLTPVFEISDPKTVDANNQEQDFVESHFPHAEQYLQKDPNATEDDQGRPLFGKLITISLDYTEKGLNIGEAIEKLVVELDTRKTVIFAYSYGVIVTQMILDILLKSNCHETFERILSAAAIRGSFLPYDEKLSILPGDALNTAMLWRSTSLANFAKLIGAPPKEVDLIRKRANEVSPEVIGGQKRTLVELSAKVEYFREIMHNQEILAKWETMEAASNDSIFPVDNLLRLARTVGIPIRTVREKHYIEPVQIVERICAASKYETV